MCGSLNENAKKKEGRSNGKSKEVKKGKNLKSAIFAKKSETLPP